MSTDAIPSPEPPGQPVPARRRRGRAGRVVAGVLALALGVVGAGVWWVVSAGPEWLRERIEQEGRQRLQRDVRLQAVELDLTNLRVGLRGLQIGQPIVAGAGAAGSAGTTALLRWELLEADIDGAALWRGRLALERVALHAPRAQLTRLENGRWDIDDLVQRLAGGSKPEPAPRPSGEIPRPGIDLTVRDVEVRDGQFVLDDRQKGQRHAVTGLELRVPRLSTRAADVESPIEGSLALALDGAPLQVKLAAKPWAAVPAGSASLQWKGLDLSPAWRHLPDSLPVRPQGGRLDLELKTEAQRGGPQGWQWRLTGQVGLADLAVHHPNGARLATWNSLTVALDDIRPLERQIGLGAIVLDGARVEARRDARGRVDLMALLAPGAVPAKASPGATPVAEPPWTVRVASVAVRAARLQWRDEAVTPATVLSVDPVDLTVGPVQWPTAAASAPWQVSLSAVLREASAGGAARTIGRLSVRGEADDRRAALGWQVDDIRLSAGGAYVRPMLQAAVDGTLRARGRVEWAGGEAPALKVSAQEVTVASLALTPLSSSPGRAMVAVSTMTSGVPPTTAVKVAQITVQDLRADLQARRLSIGRIALQKPSVWLRRLSDGQLAGVSVAAMPEPPIAPASPAGSASAGRATHAVASMPSRAKAGTTTAPGAWQVQIAGVQMQGGSFDWVDEAVSRSNADAAPARLALREIDLGLRDVAWPPRSTPMRLELALQMLALVLPGAPSAPPGRLQLSGRLGIEPVTWSGSVRVERWPVHAFEPYMAGRLPVRLNRAELGLQAQVEAQVGDGGPTVQARGQALLADVLVQTPDARCAAGGACAAAPVDDDDTLAAWNSLSLQGIDLALAPGQRPRLSLEEVRLAEFFARLLVTPEGRLNLQKVATAGSDPPVAKAELASPPSSPAAPATTAETAAATAAVPSAAATGGPAVPPAGGGWPIDLTVQRTVLANGRVDFQDRFIRPNYSADLSELNGSIGRFESGSSQMASVELRGRAAKTAMLEIRGAVNPTANPLALDLSARVTDLELAPLSAYSGKYAGYAIERGKLSFDLAYRIDPDGKLQARNQIILNQLTLGDKVDSPSATKLPVRLALYLLSDRNGVIDLDLPISGSINDPQFSIWGIVWKVVGNVITKVVTAPFAWLTGGSGPDASQVEFVAGTARIAEASAGVVDKVARALTDRPRLRMTVTGAADPQAEREAIQQAVLESRLRALLDRDRARAGGDGAPAAAGGTLGTSSASPPAPPGSASSVATAMAAQAAAPPPLPAVGTPERDVLVQRLFAQTPPPGTAPTGAKLTPQAMEAQLKAAIPVTSDSARELALQRGLSVRDALIARGLPAERLFLAAPKVRGAEETDAGWVPRVQLTIDGR